MNNIQKLNEEQTSHQAKIKTLMEAITKEISSLPDNPAITRLGNGSFTVNSKTLLNNWSAEFHDFKVQYETVIKRLSSSSDPIAALKLILISGKVPPLSYPMKLHPDVINNLSNLAGFKWKSVIDWPKGTCPYNLTPDHSEDTHDTKVQALAVCDMLRKEGFGGDHKAYPVSTMVTIV